MLDRVVYINSVIAYKQELEDKEVSIGTSSNVVRNGDLGMVLVKGDITPLDSIETMGTYDEVFADPVLDIQYKTVWDYTEPIDDGEGNISYRPEKFVVFASTPVTEAEKVAIAELATNEHIDAPIAKYNATNLTNFGGIHNCANYKDTAGYTHKQFCTDVWQFNVDVWEIARQIQIDSLTGVIPEPTLEEFMEMLPVYSGVTAP